VTADAAPIGGAGRAIGAISVTGPIARMQAHSLVRKVCDTALAIWSGQVVNRRAS
jgi:hypothetical protein